MAAETSYLATYNSLLDEHLSEYLSRPAVWRHLRRQGLVRRGGEIVGEEEWRASVHRREARDKTDRGRLEQQEEKILAEDTVREAAKRKHRQQRSNYALAGKRRLQEERHHPEYVRERNFTPLSKGDSRALGINRKDTAIQLQGYSDDLANADRDTGNKLREMLMSTHTVVRTNSNPSTSRSHSLVSSSARSIYRESPYIPRPPPSKDALPVHRRSPRREPAATEHIPIGLHGRRVIRHVNGGTPRVQSRATVTLLYRGRGIKLSGRNVQEGQSEVSVYQQHCGGNAVQVYQGYLSPDTKFSFVSRRHLDSTLGLTFYLNGLVDARVSACCEYRYKPGHGVGGAGRTCHYEWVSVREATPCFRCQAEIEVDRFIAGGEIDRNYPLKSVSVPGVKEAWVNTSPTEFVEVRNTASKTEELIPDGRGAGALTENEIEREVSRRYTLSSESDATSSVTLDSDLNETQSESERGPISGSRDNSSSLGHVTPDDRLMVPSALSGNPPSISEEVEVVDSPVSPGVCSDGANVGPVIALIGVEGSDLEHSPVDTSVHSPNLSVSTDSGDNNLSNSARIDPTSPSQNSPDVSLSSESDSEIVGKRVSAEYSPYTVSDQSIAITRNLTDDQLQELVALLQGTTIDIISIEDTRNFTPRHLTAILTHTQNIKSIRLLRNEISRDQLDIILDHLKHTVSLEISHSSIPPDHFSAFLNKLAISAPNLTEFNASNCKIEFDQSITKLLNSLIHLNCVNLSGNVLKSAILFDSLQVPHLEELCLDNAQLEERDLLELCRFIRGNATIRSLSLRDNILSNSVLQSILDMLQVNRTLKRLFFTPGTMDQSQMQHINVKLISDILDKRAI